MSTKIFCNAVGFVHPDGDLHHPAIDLSNEQKLVAPVGYRNIREASVEVEKVVAELKKAVIAKLTAMGWKPK